MQLNPETTAILPMPETVRGAALPVTPARPATGLKAFALASATLWQREVVRFLRQRSRVIGALVSPLLFWFLIGSGLGTSFQPAGASGDSHYLAYFFPGTIAMILLFTAIFSTISLIEDRREGFLQGVLVSPAPRGSLVLGKVLGSTTLAVLQGMLFLALGPFVGVSMSPVQGFAVLGAMTLTAFGLSALGFLLAWRSESVQGFHAMMNMLLFPMLLLSGAMFPQSGAAVWVQAVMQANPLSYGLALIRHALEPASVVAAAGLPPLWVCLAVTSGFGAAAFLVSWILVNRPQTRPSV